MPSFTIKHATLLRYARPIQLGPHRLMFRPRDSHDLRLIDARLSVTPTPSETRWVHDVFGNSITIMTFKGATDMLEIVSTIKLAAPTTKVFFAQLKRLLEQKKHSSASAAPGDGI